MAAHAFQVYRRTEAKGESPSIVRNSVVKVAERSVDNGFNVIVFPEREQTALYFILEYVLGKIVSGRLGNIEPLSNCKVGDKLSIGTRIKGDDEVAIVQFGGISEDVADDPRLCVGVPNGRGRGLLWEYMPLRHAHLFVKVDTSKPLTRFSKYANIKRMILARDVTNLQRLANVRSYLTKSVLCVVPSMRVAHRLMRDFMVDGRDLASCLLVGAVTENGIRTISRGQVDGIPSLLICTYMVAALDYVERNPEKIESVVVDLPSVEKALFGDAIYRLQELCRQITVVSDFAGAEGVSELVDFGFDLMQWDRLEIGRACYDYNEDSQVDIWTRNFASASISVSSVDDPLVEEAFERGRRVAVPDDDSDPAVVDAYVNLNRCMFSLIRTAMPVAGCERETCRQSIRDAVQRLKLDRRFVSDETILAYDEWSRAIERVLDRPKFAKEVLVADVVGKAKDRKVVIVVDDHGWGTLSGSSEDLKARLHPQTDESCRNDVMLVRRCEFHLLEPSLADAIVIFAGWFGGGKMRSLLFSPKVRKAVLLLYGCERRWMRSRFATWCKEFGLTPYDFGLAMPEEPELVMQNDDSAHSQEGGGVPVIEPDRYEGPKVSPIRRNRPRIAPARRHLDELEVIEFGLRGCVDRMAGARGRTGESTAVLRYELSGGYRAYFKPGHRVTCATSVVFDNGTSLETVSAEDLSEGDCVVEVAMSKDLIRTYADEILTREGRCHAREISRRWREALCAELAFENLETVISRLRTAGCERSPEAIRYWLTNEDFIGPSSLADLNAIARLTARTAGAYLVDHASDVAGAIQLVRSAHTAAGGELARRMRNRISEVIRRSGLEDPFEAGESIVFEDPGIGVIRLHRVVGAGTEQIVRSAMVNRIVSL